MILDSKTLDSLADLSVYDSLESAVEVLEPKTDSEFQTLLLRCDTSDGEKVIDYSAQTEI